MAGDRDKRWVSPAAGFTFCHLTAGAGFDCVVRDSNGVVVVFSCGKYDCRLMAIRDGLSHAVSRDLQLTCIEYNAICVVNNVNSCSFDSTFCVLDQDIIDSRRRYLSSYFCQNNMDARTLASLGISRLDSLMEAENYILVAPYDALKTDLT